MGIRFRCHHCEHELHVKDFQGGKRGKCPRCEGRFRIPPSDSPYSFEADSPLNAAEVDPPLVTAASSDPAAPTNSPASPTAVDTSQAPSGEPSPAAKTSRDQGQAVSKSTAEHKTIKNEVPSERTQVSTENRPVMSPTSGEQWHAPEVAPTSSEAVSERATAQPSQPAAGQAQLPQQLADATQTQWYVRPPTGGQFGPADSATMFLWLQEHRVSIDSLVWRDGWPDWLPASSTFQDFFMRHLVTPMRLDIHQPCHPRRLRCRRLLPPSLL